MRLPAELRLMVLGHILVYPAGVISACTHVGEEDISTPSGEQLLQEYLKRLQCSGQLLRTCQQLYIEGHSLLYEKNTMQIHTQGGDVHILYAFLSPPRMVKAEESARLDLLEFAKSIAKQFHHAYKEDAERIIRMYPALEKFKNFGINIVYADREDVFSACRMLRRLLHNRHVTFTPAPQSLSNCDAVSFLGPCKILKCQSFTLDRFDDLKHLRAAITGRTTVLDTFPLWLNFLRNFVCRLPKVNYEAFAWR